MKEKLVLLGVSILFCIIFLEIIVRVFGLVPTYLFVKDTFVEDDLLGYRLNSNLNFASITQEFSVSFTTNKDGYRDSLIKDTKFDIIGIGDSFTMGIGVEKEETFLEILEELLKKDGQNTQVINLGVGGYGTIQEERILYKECPKFKPKLVILAFFTGNDIINNYAFEEKMRNKKLGVVEGYFVEDKSESSLYNKFRIFINTKIKSYIFIKRNLIKVPLIKNIVRNFKNKYEEYRVEELQLSPKYFENNLSHAWNLTTDSLNNITNFVYKNNASLVILLIPSKSYFDENYLQRFDFEYNPFLVHDKIKEFFKNHKNIYILDLADDVIKNKENADKLYYGIDSHLNLEGNNVTAQALYNLIRDKNLV